MKKLILSLLAVMAFPLTSMASSHREAPSIARDPVADNTDLYAWVKPGTHDKLYVVANYNPLQEPSGGPNFHGLSDEVLYEVHLARGQTSLDDAITYQIRIKTAHIPRVDTTDLTKPPGGGKEFFAQLAGAAGGGIAKQTYSVVKIVNGHSTTIVQNAVVAPPNIGPRTFALVYKAEYATQAANSSDYDDAFANGFVTPMGNSGSEGTVFIGPRDDGFYVDLGGVFDLAGLRAKGTAQDGVAGYNVSTIAFELPTTLLTKNGQAPGNTPSNDTTLGVWASASRRKVKVLHRDGDDDDFGPWVQVSRIGLPLINEAVVGLQDKDKYNRTNPKHDLENIGAYILNPIIVRDAELAGFYGTGGPLAGITPPETNRTDIVGIVNLNDIPTAGAHSIQSIGDVLRVDLATDSGFPNGRTIAGGTNKEGADVTDVLLSVLLTKGAAAVSDGVDNNDKTFLNASPWLAGPWSGASQGHGKPTP